MRVPPFARVLAALVVCISTTALSQEVVDLGVIDRIKAEAFTRSEVMEHLRNLTDVHGPRLTGSPQFEEAAKWASERLTSYGLSNVHVERWGPFGRSWSIDQYSAELVAPHYMRLAAMPLAWSASTAGVRHGEPLAHAARRSLSRRLQEDRGQLRGLPPAMERQAARPDRAADAATSRRRRASKRSSSASPTRSSPR